MIAPKFSPVLEKKVGLLLSIGMAHMFFGITCMMFSEVYKTICHLRKKNIEQELSEKTTQVNETKSV